MSTPPRDNSPSPAAARQDGITALRAGDAAGARRLLAEAVMGAPDDLEAWLWLSGAVSTDGERRYCLLRVQALNPTHPAAARGLAMLPSVDPVDPLLSAFPGVSAAPALQEPPATSAAPLVVAPVAIDVRPSPPLPPSSVEVRSERAPWLLWGAVGGLSLVLVFLLGVVALRLLSPAISDQPQVAAAEPVATGTIVRPTTPASATILGQEPNSTALQSTAATSSSPTPAAPTLEPGIAPTAVAPGDDSAPALAARGLIRERRDEDYAAALADYTAAIDSDRSYADAYYLRAALLYNQGETQAAQVDYQRALQLDSASAAARYLSGRVEISRGDVAAGLAAYEDALRIDPTYAPAYYSRGVHKFTQGDIQGAIADYTAAIDADPQFAFAYGNRANLSDELAARDPSMVQAVLGDYARAIELEPLYFTAYFNRGYFYRWYLDQPEKALPDFEMATKLRPTDAPSFCELGSVRFRLNDAQGALRDTTKAIELDSEYACAYYTRGRINSAIRRYDEAIADMTRYMELEPWGVRYIDALVGRAYARGRSGDCEGAIVDYSEAIDRKPDHAVAYYDRGSCYFALGDKQAAIDDLTLAVELYRQQGPADDYQRAVEKLREVSESTQ